MIAGGYDVGIRAGNLLANDITALVSAAVHGQGLVFAPLPYVLPLFRTGAPSPVLPHRVAQPARLFLHDASRRNLPARTRVFVKFMLERRRANSDPTSDPQTLLAPFAAIARRQPTPDRIAGPGLR
jgi:DNA-binding transcriptional LysR family regulator